MNKPMTAALAAALQLASGAALAAPDARGIMVGNEDARRVQDVNSSATITTGGGTSTQKVKKFTWWRKLTADGVHFNTLTRFHAPAEVRDEGILFLEKTDGENEVLLYLPNFKKIRRVESQAQSGSFMGSEFSYSDIATPHVDDHRYKWLREEPCPGEAAVKCDVIDSEPANEGVAERTGYSRVTQWIRQDNRMGVQGDYLDREGKPWKKMQASKIEKIDKARGKWMALWLKIENLKTGKHTVLEFSSVKANQGIADSTFTQQNLSRPR